MKVRMGLWVAVSLMGFSSSVRAQNDGDHGITDGAGRTYLAPDAQIPGVNPFNMSIGTAPAGSATLRVRGDQLPVNDAFLTSLCTFRTDVDADHNQNWSMVRDGLEIGRLWHTNPGLPFHIQSTAAPDYVNNLGSGLYLQNNDGDGMKISHNGPLFLVASVPRAWIRRVSERATL